MSSKDAGARDKPGRVRTAIEYRHGRYLPDAPLFQGRKNKFFTIDLTLIVELT